MKNLAGLIILVVWLFIWQGTAVAANWLFVQRLEGTRMGACNEYIDAESVVRNGDRLIYWTLWLYDKPFGNQAAERILSKKEAVPGEPGQVRTNGVPLAFTAENAWRELRPGSVEMQVRQIGLNWFRGDMEGI